jgi:hypothetical protein
MSQFPKSGKTQIKADCRSSTRLILSRGNHFNYKASCSKVFFALMAKDKEIPWERAAPIIICARQRLSLRDISTHKEELLASRQDIREGNWEQILPNPVPE